MKEINTQAEKSFSDQERYLQFNLGNETYAIRLLYVKEVIPVPETTVLPNSPGHYVGIMNLRGQIISILDLRKKLKIQPQENSEEGVIIVELEGVAIGVVVDSINRVLSLSEDKVSEVPEVNSEMNAKYIEAVYQGEGSLTVLLNLHSVFNINEIKKLQQAAA
jgi:purine-binding chemotaxis protein CheW